MKRALVTGAGGFVGANLVRRLLVDGHEVHALVRASDSPWRLADVAADVHQYNVALEDRDGLSDLVSMVRPDWLFHLGAHGGYASQTDVDRIMHSNVIGTVHLVQAAVRTQFESFVYTGSSSEYGDKDHAPTEDELIEPASDYAVTKAAATLYCQFMSRRSELPITTLRLYSVFGPWEEPGRLMPTLAVHALRGALPPLVAPDTVRDFVFVDDVVDACVLAARTSGVQLGAIFNVGSGQQTRLDELVGFVREELHLAVEPVWGSMKPRAWDTRVWVADPAKIQRELGWRAEHTVEVGFRRLLQWMREHPDVRDIYEMG
jgi:UDP-glucose 4-epimerase